MTASPPIGLTADPIIKIGDADKEELTERFSTMPPHNEVPAALRKLRAAGFRLFTLTDNLLEVQTRQLEHGGIADLFERRFSADGVKQHKPSRQAYAYVERELGVGPQPQIVGADLNDVADQLITRHNGRA